MTARPMLPRLACALLFVLALALPASARVARVKLADLTREADCIVIARVESVLSFDGLPVARAVPERTLKGDPGAGPLYFVAGKTWACDVSAAVRGETALLFLQRSPSGRIERHLLRLPTAKVPHTPLFRLAKAGRGRMPVAGHAAEQRVTVPFDVELPTGVSVIRDPKNTRASAPQTALLAAVVRTLQQEAAPTQPAHLIPTPPRLLLASGINANGELLVQTYRSVTRLPASARELPTGTSYKTTVPVGLEGVTILSGSGQPVPQAEARRRLVRETSVLVMANGEKPAAVYLRAVAPGTLIFVFPREAPAFEPAKWPVDQPADPLNGRRP